MTTDTKTAAWRNVSAGPRQVKDLNKAVGALRWEGQTFTQVTGVIGDEHRTTLTSMFGGVRPEVTELDEKIRARYGHEVTSANVRAIIADYAAATIEAEKSRHVKDERRTAEEDAELKAKVAAQQAEYQATRDAGNAVLDQVMAKAPAGAKALIIAEYHEDASNPMTDYFASRTVRTVAIGWRLSSREDFRALRSAAARFGETAHIAGDEDAEHRENYSMGSGNYLSDHGSARSGTGWIVRSAALPCQWVHLTGDAIPEVAATAPMCGRTPPDLPAGTVTVSPSSIGREGVVEVRFAEKPSDDVIAGLKAHGFRWARGNRCWYGRDVAYAESLTSG